MSSTNTYRAFCVMHKENTYIGEFEGPDFISALSLHFQNDPNFAIEDGLPFLGGFLIIEDYND